MYEDAARVKLNDFFVAFEGICVVCDVIKVIVVCVDVCEKFDVFCVLCIVNDVVVMCEDVFIVVGGVAMSDLSALDEMEFVFDWNVVKLSGRIELV